MDDASAHDSAAHDASAHDAVERFIEHWGESAAAETANFQSFANDLCDLIPCLIRMFAEDADPPLNASVRF